MSCVTECQKWQCLVSLTITECQKGQCLVSVDVSECSHQAPRSVGPPEWHMQLLCIYTLFTIVWYYLCGITYLYTCVVLPICSVWYCPAEQCGTDWVTHAAILPPFCRVNLALPPRPRHSVHNAMNCADNTDTNMFTNTDTNTNTETETDTNTHLGQSSVN